MSTEAEQREIFDSHLYVQFSLKAQTIKRMVEEDRWPGITSDELRTLHDEKMDEWEENIKLWIRQYFPQFANPHSIYPPAGELTFRSKGLI